METVHTLRRAALVALLCLAVVAGSLGAALAKQGSHATHPVPTKPHIGTAIRGWASVPYRATKMTNLLSRPVVALTHTFEYAAIIRCKGMAEDTAAHIRLIQYKVTGDDNLVIVYHCKHLGY